MTGARIARVYCGLAALCDGGTGLLLITSPLSTLDLMRVPHPAEVVWLRFIGAFVLGVGATYLLPLLGRDAPAQRAWGRAIFASTATVRLCVAAVVATAVATGSLAPAWSSVWITDLLLATAQVLVLARGGPRLA